MLYRILADTITGWVDADAPREDAARPSGTGLRGAWASGGPCATLDGLPLPPLTNRRVRFWYTEEGWRAYGLAHCGELRAAGHTVRVIRAKNPSGSRVAYRDRYQVALLPPSSRKG
ncbi:hypothetical protein GCM10009530_55620 [Microbispora corallina]|uniref:Transposase n=1 Tax=Microbispora corallina TaxID=83302 RepID=A0ABQ4G719_9ACTN|nr:hypothetical protein [Microbispora corallina]GIH42835.1 hypothetical protein Mco01_58350 [Microbispora corallina]